MPGQSRKWEPSFQPSAVMVVPRFQFLSVWYKGWDEHHPFEVGLARGDAEHVSLLSWPVFLYLVTSIHINIRLAFFLKILDVVPVIVVVV